MLIRLNFVAWHMTLDNCISLVSAVIAFAGLFLVAWQIRASTKQQELQSLVKIYDINRKLLTLGFNHPSLFDILDDAKHENPVWQRRYLQLWLNLFALSQHHVKESVFKDDLKESLTRDISEFMSLKNMREHWSRFGPFYPVSFQKMVNDIIKTKNGEPPSPATAAHADQATKT